MARLVGLANADPTTAIGRTTRVLLVEDNRDYARLVQVMLPRAWPERLDVEHVESLAAAGQQLAAVSPDCVLLDLALADARGLEALMRIRTIAPGVPVVVLTGIDDEAVAVEAVQEGAQDYLVKGRSDGSLIARSIRYAIERKGAQLELAHQALHDALTGLPNRALFLDRLELSLIRSRRRPARIAVLFLDLDAFKLVNDSLGHDAGDQLLVELAERLRTVVRPSDTVARFGGDEFTILCDQLASEYDAVSIATRVAEEIGDPLAIDGREVFVTASVGIAYADGAWADPTTLIRNADAAMYRAKERGGARYEVFDEALQARALKRLETQSALHRALGRGELRLHYQPQVELDTSHVVGVEALVRWEHPERGLLDACEFIELAEESGLIDSIGEWTLRRACEQLRSWDKAFGDDAPRMAVNLSARELGEDHMAERLADALRESGANPAHLCIEITERGVVEEPERAAERLGRLKRLGVRLAIDDFGTGHASLGYLDRFPIDVLKIDRSFLERLGPEPGSRRLVAAILSLAGALELEAVAEGVERPDQVDALISVGCRLGQGFRFAPALSAGELEGRLSERTSR